MRFVRHEQSSLDRVVGAAAAALSLNAEVLELELCPESTAEHIFFTRKLCIFKSGQASQLSELGRANALCGNFEISCFVITPQVRRRSLALQRWLPHLPTPEPQRPLSASPKRRARSWTAASWTCTASAGLLPSSCLLRRQELVCKRTNVLSFVLPALCLRPSYDRHESLGGRFAIPNEPAVFSPLLSLHQGMPWPSIREALKIRWTARYPCAQAFCGCWSCSRWDL